MGAVLRRSGILAALLFTALPAPAHHSRAIYDREQTITIEGIVTKFEWANPHVYLYVETGDSVEWAIEQSSTTAMRRRGWSPDTLAPGDRVTVQANPTRESGRNMALVASVEKAGVTLFDTADPDRGLNPSERPVVRANGLAGTWVVEQGPLVGLFSEPSAWALTEKAARARAAYDDTTMNPQINCMARTAPWFMIFPSVQKVEIGESAVSVRSEYDTIGRIIRTDSATHDGAAVSYQGHSIGWWEGEVFVVDTMHFADHRSGHARGIPSGAQKHLVERFQLSPDRTSLTYRFELEDPEHLAARVTGEVRSRYRPDLEFSPVTCDPENARRFVGD